MPDPIFRSLICPNCNTANDSDARFCRECGASIDRRCRICNLIVDRDAVNCPNCGFNLDDAEYLRTLGPESIPPAVAQGVLEKLNTVVSAEDLFALIPLLGEEDTGLELARRIVEKRSQLGNFSDLGQVTAITGLGLARFTELVLSLGVEVQPFVPHLSQGNLQPAEPRFSASITELEFEYQILMPGPFEGKVGRVMAARCSSCSAFAPFFNEELGVWESQVEITRLLLDGENDDAVFSIFMDQGMQPYDWMHPLDPSAEQFQFPAKMQLNNNMTLKVRIKATGETLSLVSRDVPCQVARVTQWPPYGIRLHTQRPIDYHDENNPLGEPVIRILDATAFLLGPTAFLSHRADILEAEYIPAATERDLPAVWMRWLPVPDDAPHGRYADHYHVYRSTNPGLGEASWTQMSECIKEDRWIDWNPPRSPLHYRVVPVWRTIMGEDYEGFPGQHRRIEPEESVFRV